MAQKPQSYEFYSSDYLKFEAAVAYQKCEKVLQFGSVAVKDEFQILAVTAVWQHHSTY